jgi:hypothetical protein
MKETPKESAKNNIIEDWLKEHGDPEVDKEVECKLEQITLEEAAEKHINSENKYNRILSGHSFVEGAKWQAERMYSEEDMLKCWNAAYIDALAIDEETYKPLFFEDFIEQFKKK